MTRPDDVMATDQQEGLVIERMFSAPQGLVWRAWTEAEHFARWYGPQGMTMHVCEVDFRVGGRYLYGLRSPAGFEYYTAGVYQEIVAPKRFVAIETLADAMGQPVAPGHYGMPEDAPPEMTVIVSLEAVDDRRTRLTLRHIAAWPRPEMAAGASAGWNGAFDKLEQALAAMA